MPNHASYPTLFPIRCFTETIDIIRSGEVSAKRADLAAHLWNIQGYAQKVVFGDPQERKRLFGSNDEQHVVQLEAALQELKDTPDVELFGGDDLFSGDDDVAAAIDPATIIALVSFILSLIEKWRNR